MGEQYAKRIMKLELGNILEEETSLRRAVLPWTRFEGTKQSKLMFIALLTDDAQEVRFERVATG